MRFLVLFMTVSVLGLSACSLQLPGGNVADEPFFEGTYEE